MKIKIIFIITLLLIMAFLPIAISKCTANKTTLTAYSTANEVTKPEPDASEISTIPTQPQTEPVTADKPELGEAELCGLVASNYDESYNDETLKALAVILYTNYITSPDNYDLTDTNICLPENKAENSTKENYVKIKSAVSAVYKKTLCQCGKAFYIPVSVCSNGKTTTSTDYPYLTAVASPWDCYSEYSKEENCYGVSLYGLNYLTSNDSDYKDALLWYLPDFDIS